METCRCGADCPLCNECGSPKCECYCDYYEDADERENENATDEW